MKKKKLLVITIAVLSFLFILTSCGDKTAMTSEDFKVTMEKEGYTITDATDQFAGYDYVTKVYIASSEDRTYQIEFYEISTEEYADGVYQNNMSIFKDSYDEGSSSNVVEVSSDGENYSYYSLSGNDTFKYVCRVDKTMLYLDVESKYKDTVKEIVEKLGY